MDFSYRGEQGDNGTMSATSGDAGPEEDGRRWPAMMCKHTNDGSSQTHRKMNVNSFQVAQKTRLVLVELHWLIKENT